MGGVVWMSSRVVQHWLGIGRLGRLVDLAASIPIGLVVFYLACRLLRVSELDLATRALAGPLLRRLRRFGITRYSRSYGRVASAFVPVVGFPAT